MASERCLSLADQKRLFGDTELNEEELLEAVNQRIRGNTLQARQRKLAALNYQYHQNNLARLLDGVESEKQRGKIAKEYVKSIISPQTTAKYGANRAIELEAEAIQREKFAPLAAGLEKYRLKTGARLRFQDANKGDNSDLIKAIVDDVKVDADAADFARRWADVAESLRKEFNALGGDIPKLADWKLPQAHDALKVNRATFEEWYGDIKPLLDLDKMDMTEIEMDTIARDMYDNIRTEGRSKLKPGSIPKYATQAIANRNREHRFFKFRDGDAWLKYQEKYGRGVSVMDTMLAYIQDMASDIAMMRTMGPNPAAMYQKLRDTVDIVGNNTASLEMLDNMWAEISGKLVPSNSTAQKWSQVGDVLASYQIATKLGSALLSALPDEFFSWMTHWFNGTATFRSAFGAITKLKPSSKEDRIFATQIGLNADYAIRSVNAASRFSEVTGYHTMSKISDITMRASGFNLWNNATRQEFELNFLQGLVRGVSNWASLGAKRQAAFERYGITAADWPQVRTGIVKRKNVPILNAMSIEDTDVRRKVLGMLVEEARHAVPEPNIRSRAWMHFGKERGTVEGEFLRAFMTFKSFPITMITTHMARAFNQPGAMNKLKYATLMFAGTTALGFLAMNAKRIAAGKEPLSFEDRKAWGAAMAQGGGLGILGDFIFSDHSRYGASIWSTALGPAFGDLDRYLIQYLLGSGQQFLELDHDKAMDRMRRIPGAVVKDLTPGQLWYTKLLMQRYLFDFINQETDPKWAARMRNQENRMYREEGARFWWKPGGTPRPENIAPEF